MNSLRLREGYLEREFEQRTGLSSALLRPQLEHLRTRGLMEHHADRWITSPQGFDFLNDVIAEFLPSRPEAAVRQG
jgi:coproporphyrinogen III oxidase-like Fe-S oxidoreductase